MRITDRELPSRFRRSLARALVGLALAGPLAPAAAQQPTFFERGVTGTSLLLRQLDGVKRVLLIGAHPDDEDTALLTTLARGLGAETAYLALTRGDGGQNLIGPELFEGLGVVRTGELLAARSLDGGRQFFTRAFDFGYSKRADEALGFWPRDELLRDVVWVVRTFQPQVIVSIFTGTPLDGHGQHQAAGLMARQAFTAAADPDQFEELAARGARPWQASKLYRLARGAADTVTLRVETGSYDPVLGRSYFQLAMRSRSQHRSQDMGVAQPFGSRASTLVLIGTAPGMQVDPGAGLFAGVDTTLVAAVGGLAGEVASRVRATLDLYRSDLASARAALSALNPAAATPALARAAARLEVAVGAVRAEGTAGAASGDVLEKRLGRVREAVVRSAGVIVRASVDDDLVVPAQDVRLTVEIWNGGPYELDGVRPSVELPSGWKAGRFVPYEPPAGRGFFSRGAAGIAGDPVAPARVPSGAVVRWSYELSVPSDAAVSRLYYRRRPRDGEMYRWPEETSSWALPKDPPPIRASVRMAVHAAAEVVRLAAPTEVRYVGVDKAVGEFDKPLLIVPPVSVATTPRSLVWPARLAETREVEVELRGEAALSGSLRLDTPSGWRVEPDSVPFRIEGPGGTRSVSFRVTPAGAGEGRFEFRAVATASDGRRFDEGYRLIDYPHIERTALFAPAATAVTVVPVRVAEGLVVGYVMGSGDDGMEALRQMGVAVEPLSPARVRAGDFDGLDALVLGIRAYETRPDLVASNGRILDFARAGGTVVVQYNKFEYPRGGFAPYPVSMGQGRGAPRVTDEHSPVEFVDPGSPLYSTPNQLTAADFEGWVQERGLYFLAEWDERFRPQLALTDPGEEPTLGSILIAPVGEGLYAYAALSFFREFPAGVAGAYRLFANLVSLDARDWARHLASGESAR